MNDVTPSKMLFGDFLTRKEENQEEKERWQNL